MVFHGFIFPFVCFWYYLLICSVYYVFLEDFIYMVLYGFFSICCFRPIFPPICLSVVTFRRFWFLSLLNKLVFNVRICMLSYIWFSIMCNYSICICCSLCALYTNLLSHTRILDLRCNSFYRFVKSKISVALVSPTFECPVAVALSNPRLLKLANSYCSLIFVLVSISVREVYFQLLCVVYRSF